MPKKHQKQQKPGKGAPKDAKQPKAGAATASTKAVQLSLANEARVREFLEELSHATPSSSSATAAPLSAQQLQQAYQEAYEQLLRYGFSAAQVQDALSALPQHTVSTEAALDWLCLHVPPAELPRRFVGQGRAAAAAAGGITVKVKGGTAGPRPAPDAGYQPAITSSDDSSEEGQEGSPEGEGPGAETNHQAAADLQKEEAERQALKDRILQQYGGDSEDEVDDQASQAASEDSIVEDWELWGDPREIERRRAERAFRMQTPEQQRLALAREWAAAREWATAAKAAGDKATQKSAGQLIGKLNAEMAQLGLSQGDALVLLAEAGGGVPLAGPRDSSSSSGKDAAGSKPTSPGIDESSTPASADKQQQQQQNGDSHTDSISQQQQQQQQRQQSGSGDGDDWEASQLLKGPAAGPSADTPLAAEAATAAAEVGGQRGVPPGSEGAGTEPPAAAAAAAACVGGDGDGGGPEEGWMMDLFDEAATSAAAAPGAGASSAAAKPAAAPAAAGGPVAAPPPALTPWGAYGTTTRKTKASKLKARPEAPVREEKLPRAVLQQYCQTQGWQPPRFERIPGQGYRYKAVVVPAAPAGGGKKKGSSSKVQPAPRSFQLFADEDTWTSITDAQQAAATRALFDLLQPAPDADKQGVLDQLGTPWRGLWEGWAAGAGGAGWEAANQEEEQQRRDAFISQLLAKQTSVASGAAGAASTAAAAGSAAAAADWAPDVDPEAAAEAAAAAEEAAAAEARRTLTFTSSMTAEAPGGSDEDEELQVATGGDLVTGDEEAEEWEVATAADEAAEQRDREQQQQQAAEDAAANAAQQARLQARSHHLRQQLLSWRTTHEGQRWQQQRGQLPMASQREAVVAALEASDVVVVGGETGSGKTTQVPQFILEDAVLSGAGASCSIVVTQPRRIAAITVAQRVAAERGEQRPGAAVGYHVRLEAAAGRDTQLLFCTTGILLRRMTSDPLLSALTHVVVDEVHERTTQGDFLLALLRRVLVARNTHNAQARAQAGGSRAGPGAGVLPPLKVVLMSATLDAGLYSKYFGGCPVISCQGRTFPVAAHYLEDVYRLTGYRLAPDARAALRSGGRAGAASLSRAAGKGDRGRQNLLKAGWGDEDAGGGPLNPYYDSDGYQDQPSFVRTNLARVNEDVLDMDLLEDLVGHVDDTIEPGAILVFLPGMGEISGLLTRLSSSSRYNRNQHWLLPLHSSISPAQQQQAFAVPPPGVRKIVLSTNIAETSVTVEDVVAVIDSGRHKERRYDPHRHMSLLVEDWISRAAAMQRRGRAGRVRPGVCYCLYTQHRFDSVLRRYQIPEIARVPLEELILQLHLMHLGPAATFLESVLEPPPPKAVVSSVAALEEIGALQLIPAATSSSKQTGGAAGTKAGGGGVEEVLTPLGRHLAMLPLDPRLGKLLVLGACLGCLAPALTIAAAFSHKSPFTASLEQQPKMEAVKRALVAPDAAESAAAMGASGSSSSKGSKSSSAAPGLGPGQVSPGVTTALRLAAGQQSDHLLLVAVFELWRQARATGGERAAAQVARQYYLSTQALDALSQLRGQFASMLQDTHLVPHTGGSHSSSSGSSSSPEGWMDDPKHPCNRFAQRPEMVKAALVAALSPHVVVQLPGCRPGSRPGWGDAQHQELYLHPSSVLHELEVQVYRHPYVVYLEKTKTSRVFVRECSAVSPLALLLFGGTLAVQHEQGTILLNGWCHIPAPAQTAVLVKKVRDALDSLLEESVAGLGRGKGAGSSKQMQAGSSGAGNGSTGEQGVTTARVVDMIQQLLVDAEQQHV